jgi:hypothetical protein
LQVPRVSNHVRVTTIERLDQGHLYFNLEVPGSRPGIEPSEHSRKEPSRQLVISYSEHLHISPLQYVYKNFHYNFKDAISSKIYTVFFDSGPIIIVFIRKFVSVPMARSVGLQFMKALFS